MVAFDATEEVTVRAIPDNAVGKANQHNTLSTVPSQSLFSLYSLSPLVN